MAYDSIADKAKLNAKLTSIADAIRTKGGTSAKLDFYTTDYEDAISAIPSGGECPEKKILDQLLSGTIKEITTDISVLKVGPFNYCSNLVSARLNNAIELPSYCFDHCGSLINIYAPKAKNVTPFSIGNCDSLVEVVLPKVERVFEDGFRRSEKLTKVDLPLANQLGHKAFDGTNLTTLVLRASTVAILDDDTAFSNCPVSSGTGFVYVPKNLVDQYKVSPNWSTYANKIRAIEDYPDVTGA